MLYFGDHPNQARRGEEEGGRKEREVINHTFSGISPLSVTGGYSKKTRKTKQVKSLSLWNKDQVPHVGMWSSWIYLLRPSAATSSALCELRRSG